MKLKDRVLSKIPEKRRSALKNALHIGRVVKNVVCWTMIAILSFFVITFLLNRVSGVTPSLFGYTIQRISTGSMEPELRVGDVIFSHNVEDVETIEVGDIITFKGGAQFSDQNVTHRVIVAPKEENGQIMLQTQGDANKVADNPIRADSVQSKYICKLSFLTKLYEMFLSPWGLIIFIGLLLLIFFDELLNIVRIVTNSDIKEEETIEEIIERLQREDAQKAVLEEKTIEDAGQWDDKAEN